MIFPLQPTMPGLGMGATKSFIFSSLTGTSDFDPVSGTMGATPNQLPGPLFDLQAAL